VAKLWDDWYKEGIHLIVQDRKVSEKWRTYWLVKDNKKISRLKFIVEYIQARSEKKPVGLVIAELEKLQGRKKLSTLEHKVKDKIKLAVGKLIVEWIIPQKTKIDCFTKDLNGSFHKTKKWIVPQKQTKKRSFHRDRNGKVFL
jgi:hypothetical protein